MKYQVETIECKDGAPFRVYTVTEGEGYLVYYYNGSGITSKHLRAGESWTEGVQEEFDGLYETAEEAENAIKRVLG